MRVEALEEALARYRPKLIYLIPAFQNPTGAVLTAERRRRVLDLALQYRVPVVESDLYGDLYFEQEPPAGLKAQDGAGVVIYQGGGSKLGLPGLRVGWLVAPIPAMAALTVAKTFEDLHTAALTQRLAAAFIGSPHAERHLARLRVECRVRRDALVGALRQHCPRLRFRVPAGSYYLWVTLPAPLTVETLLPVALEHGVGVRSGTAFSPNGGGLDHIVSATRRSRPIGSWRAPAGSGQRSSRSWHGTAPRPRHGPCRPESSEPDGVARVSARPARLREAERARRPSARARAPRAPPPACRDPPPARRAPAAPGSG